jgi:hypothetical protein
VIGYGVAGVFTDQDKQFAEVGMVHISPEARDFGLGGLVSSVMHQRLLKQSPDGFHAVIGDTTGKINHLVAAMGYESHGYAEGHGAHPVARRYFTSEADKEIFAGQIDAAIDMQAARLAGRSGSCERRPG